MIVTGHCPFGMLAENFCIPSNGYCGTEEKEETVFHTMFQCPALADKIIMLLAYFFLDYLTSLSDIEVAAIAKFI